MSDPLIDVLDDILDLLEGMAETKPEQVGHFGEHEHVILPWDDCKRLDRIRDKLTTLRTARKENQ
jgi:hypothetical protein